MNQSVLEAKKAVVKEVANKITESQSTVVVEYRGLSVAKMTELRRKLRDENVEMKIYKNKLVSRAAESVGFEALNESLTGPNAFVFGEDAVAPSRLLAEFARKNKALVFKSGIVEGKLVTVDMLKELATLPNRDGMIAMLLGLFQAPVRNLAYALDQVAEQKESEPEAEVKTEPEVVAVEAEAQEAPAEAVKPEEPVKEAKPEAEAKPEEVVKEAKPKATKAAAKKEEVVEAKPEKPAKAAKPKVTKADAKEKEAEKAEPKKAVKETKAEPAKAAKPKTAKATTKEKEVEKAEPKKAVKETKEKPAKEAKKETAEAVEVEVKEAAVKEAKAEAAVEEGKSEE